MIYKDYLTFPGNGVHTVHTARDKKEKLTQKYYNTKDFDVAAKKWKESLDSKHKVCLLGAPADCGAGIVRGSNWGPLYLREKILEENAQDFLDCGDIRVVPHLLHDKYLNKETIENVRNALGLREGQPVSPLSMLEDFAKDFYKNYPNRHLLTFGGDHSISYPLSHEWVKAFKDDDIGILHFDAHTDLLDERLGIDFCFGSWAYHTLLAMKDPGAFVQVGIRSSGKDKAFWEKKFGLKQIWTQEVLEQGADKISEEIIEQYKSRGIKKLYLSFDIDAIDSKYVSATGTPEADGLAPFHCLEILSRVSEHFEISCADVVEVAPFINYPEDESGVEPHSTLESAFGIINFLLELWNKA